MKFIKKLLQLAEKTFKCDINDKEQIIKKENFNKTQVGDVIWAKRYTTLKQKKLIPEGHQEGPFIVVIKDGNNLICSQGTSVYKENNNYYEIKTSKCNLKKCTYFRLYNFCKINLDMFVEKLDTLDSKELKSFFKLVKQYNVMEDNICNKIPLQESEIIEQSGEKYLIIGIDENKLTCVPLNKIEINSNITINDLNKIDYSKILTLKNTNNYKYLGILKNSLYIYVLKSYKDYINYSKNKEIVQRGSVIFKDGKLYYIYGEESNNWLVFEIVTIKQRNYKNINIGDEKYYTNFLDIKIDKKSDFKIIYLCRQDEIINIKNIRKNYKEIEKEKRENEINRHLRLDIGEIIECKHYKNKRYIITKQCKKTYECLSIDEIREGIYNPLLIKREDSIISSNTSLEGIKWLEMNPNFKLTRIGEQKKLDIIFNTQREFLKELNCSCITINPFIDRGSIINLNNNYYYIYGEEKNDWLIFKLVNERYFNFDKLALNGKLYYTNYVSDKINKNERLNLVYTCTQEEIESVSKSKKTYKKINSQYEQDKKLVTGINVGSTVKRNEFSEETFIVKDILGDMLVCISSSESGIANPTKHYFKKDNVIVIKNKQKRK